MNEFEIIAVHIKKWWLLEYLIEFLHSLIIEEIEYNRLIFMIESIIVVQNSNYGMIY